ncbi:MAG: hypothetical protein ACTSRK_09805 [Promethearchaeota archaeon]
MPFSVVNGRIITYHPYTGAIHYGKVMRMHSFILAKILNPDSTSVLNKPGYKFLLDYLGTIPGIAGYVIELTDSRGNVIGYQLDNTQYDPTVH